jgi:hypothetical protein
MSHEFLCKPFAGRIRNHFPPLVGRELLDHIVELTRSIPNFPRILNRDLGPVLQHARVSSPNASASNVFISGIPCALDSYQQFENENSLKILIARGTWVDFNVQ